MTDRREKRYVAIVEARMTSSRLPGKIMMQVGGRPSLAVLLERLARVPALDDIVVATTVNRDDDPLEALCARMGVGCFRGSEEDVLRRVLDAARAHDADVVVEITGDCTLLDPAVVQEGVEAYAASTADFVANCVRRPHYPPGMDVRVFSTDALADVDRRATSPDDREHVSLHFWEHPERYVNLHVTPPPAFERPDLFIALDEEADLELMRAIHDALAPREPFFSLADILSFLDENPGLLARTQEVSRKGAHDA